MGNEFGGDHKSLLTDIFDGEGCTDKGATLEQFMTVLNELDEDAKEGEIHIY